MRTSSKILMALNGLLLIALGVLCIVNSNETLVGIAWLIGLFILLAGIAAFVSWIYLHGIMFNSAGLLLGSILEMLVGIMFLGNGGIVLAEAFPYIFGFWALVSGADLAIRSFDFKQVGFKYWWIMLILGIAGAVLGGLSLAKPIVGANAITVILGISIIIDGVGYILALFGINKFEKNVKKLID